VLFLGLKAEASTKQTKWPKALLRAIELQILRLRCAPSQDDTFVCRADLLFGAEFGLSYGPVGVAYFESCEAADGHVFSELALVAIMSLMAFSLERA
jgi:hypothetical protein